MYLNIYPEKKSIPLHKADFEFPCGDALNAGIKSYSGPVIEKVDGVNEYRIKLDAMIGKTPEAKKVIDKLVKIFSAPDKYLGLQGSVVITPGVVFTFNNRTLGHGRPAFVGEKAPVTVIQQQEGQERWLQRITGQEQTIARE